MAPPVSAESVVETAGSRTDRPPACCRGRGTAVALAPVVDGMLEAGLYSLSRSRAFGGSDSLVAWGRALGVCRSG